MIPEYQQKANRLEAMRFFVDEGFAVIHAAGIVGNLQVESFMDPTIAEIGHPNRGFGLTQWTHPSRKAALKRFATEHMLPVTDFRLQLLFVADEYSRVEFSGALKALNRSKTVAEAAIAVCDKYERPGIPHRERRIKAAMQAYDEYQEYLTTKGEDI